MLKDVWSILISPIRFFQSLEERPRWVGAAILLLIVTAAGFALMLDETVEFGREQAMKDLPDEESREKLEKFFDHPILKVVVVIAPGGTHLLSTLLYGAIALLILTVTGGGLPPKPFGRIFSVGVWAKLVEIPHIILLVPLTKITGSPEIYFGPAAILQGDMTDKLFRFAAGFDIFHLWSVALFVIGLRICLKISNRRALLAVGLPWLVRQLIRLAWA